MLNGYSAVPSRDNGSKHGYRISSRVLARLVAQKHGKTIDVPQGLARQPKQKTNKINILNILYVHWWPWACIERPSQFQHNKVIIIQTHHTGTPLMVYQYHPYKILKDAKQPISRAFFYQYCCLRNIMTTIMTTIMTNVTKGLTKVTKPIFYI